MHRLPACGPECRDSFTRRFPFKRPLSIALEFSKVEQVNRFSNMHPDKTSYLPKLSQIVVQNVPQSSDFFKIKDSAYSLDHFLIF